MYRAESMELRAGDRIRWTRNDKTLGVVNSGMAEVAGVRNGRVAFLLEDGRAVTLDRGDPQLRHVDYAWASTVHAFQGHTVDQVIAAMPANHPHLTTAKSFYVEISRARDRAELVTDDAKALRERLEATTGERISALEGIGKSQRPKRQRKTAPRLERESVPQLEREPAPQVQEKEQEKEQKREQKQKKEWPKYPEVPFPPLPDPELDWAPRPEKAPRPDIEWAPASGKALEPDIERAPLPEKEIEPATPAREKRGGKDFGL